MQRLRHLTGRTLAAKQLNPMLFIETFEKYNDYVYEAVEELFLQAFNNQQNHTDLLLVLLNALENDYSKETIERLKISNYQIGPDFIGFRYNSFYKFIDQYRDKLFKKSEHISELKKDPFERNYLYHYLIEQELLIYMKFWESDLILRRLYNISRLARGLNYEWKYKQSFFNERRKVVKEHIQKDLKRIAPKFNMLLDEIYNRQIRNAIAHSQYYLMYDSINLTNKDENIHYKLGYITYTDWEIMFHKNLLLYNYMIIVTNQYLEKYRDEAEGIHSGLSITFPEKDKKGNDVKGWIKFDNDLVGWDWNYQ